MYLNNNNKLSIISNKLIIISNKLSPISNNIKMLVHAILVHATLVRQTLCFIYMSVTSYAHSAYYYACDA